MQCTIRISTEEGTARDRTCRSSEEIEGGGDQEGRGGAHEGRSSNEWRTPTVLRELRKNFDTNPQ